MRFPVIHPHNPDAVLFCKIDLIPVCSMLIGMNIKDRHITKGGDRFGLTLNEQSWHGIIPVGIPAGKEKNF